jgi:hypothetical protein
MSDSNPARARFAHLTAVFHTVLEKYKYLCNLHPLVASQIDHDAPLNRRLDFSACDYLIDIQNACAYAVRGQRNEAELKDAIARLIAGDHTVPETLMRQAIRLCGTAFESRRLEPIAYLRRIRRGRGERVRMAA